MTAESADKSAETLYEVGRLYRDRGDFGVAIEKLSVASELYLREKNFDRYLKCFNMIIRMHAERMEYDKVADAKEKLQDLVLREGFQLNAKTYYVLGACANYKGQVDLDLALDYFQKSLATALAADNKEDMCYAINGIAVVYFRLGRPQEALKEVYNLQVFFQFLDLPELKVSTQILNGLIFRDMERYDQALEILWQTYDLLREEKNLCMYLNLLYAMGTTYQKAGNSELARLYLHLAKKSADPENLKELVSQVDARLSELGVRTKDDFDLVFDSASNTVVERRKGKVDFKNQFILLDLLHLFLKSPGKVFSKEDLVKRIWNQEYDPAVHDNKIYVTIKRLRKLIEPDYDKPKYIFRSKNGYYLNKGTKVLLEQ